MKQTQAHVGTGQRPQREQGVVEAACVVFAGKERAERVDDRKVATVCSGQVEDLLNQGLPLPRRGDGEERLREQADIAAEVVLADAGAEKGVRPLGV